MARRWARRFLDEDAAPVAALAVVQLAGRNYGRPVLCMPTDVDEVMVANLLIATGQELLRRKGTA